MCVCVCVCVCVIIYLNMESSESAKETALPPHVKWCRATIANKPISLEHLKVPTLLGAQVQSCSRKRKHPPSSLPIKQLFIALRVLWSASNNNGLYHHHYHHGLIFFGTLQCDHKMFPHLVYPLILIKTTVWIRYCWPQFHIRKWRLKGDRLQRMKSVLIPRPPDF